MTRENGFLPLRRGLWEHIRNGQMSVTMALGFIYICSQADTRTGVWSGSSGALHVELGVSERTARDVLEKLEQRGYIRRFAVSGSHTCYPILVHKFAITTGDHNGEQLNAINSKSPTDLEYFPRDHNGGQDGEHSAAQKIIKNGDKRQEKENPAANPTPPVVPAGVWTAFVEHRHKLRRPMTARATELVLQKLEKLQAAGHDPAQLLETAMERGWLTVFEPDGRGRRNESFQERNIRIGKAAADEVRRRASEILSEMGNDLPEQSDRQGNHRALPRSARRPDPGAN